MIDISFEDVADINEAFESKHYSDEYVNCVVSSSNFGDVLNFYGFEAHQQSNGELLMFCPFHDDQHHPNMFVNCQKGVFICFSCGQRGNILSFITKMESRTNKSFKFSRAVEILARLSGIEELTEEEVMDRNLRNICEEAPEEENVYGMDADVFNITVSMMCREFLMEHHNDLDFVEGVYRQIDDALKKKDFDDLKRVYRDIPGLLKGRESGR